MPGSFVDIPLKRHYDSDQHDVLATFYRPLLKSAQIYDRAVGYFSESAIKACAMELADFIEKDGQIRLIVGFFTSEKELATLDAEKRSDFERSLIKTELVRVLRELEEKDLRSLTIVGSLVASGVAEIRFAIRDQGIYHAKYGVLKDREGNSVAFIGSVNETEAAMTHGMNHESFSVYRSTEPEIYKAYGTDLEKTFDDLWNGKSEKTRIYSIDEETLELIRTRYSQRQPDDKAGGELAPLPTKYELRNYQQEALKSWQNKSYRGILAMATGAGKTIIAIDAVNKIRKAIPYGAVAITVPYQNLAVQWMRALRDHGHAVIPIFDKSADWRDVVRNLILAAQLGPTELPCFVCVNKTFRTDEFQELVALLAAIQERRHLLIVDECHHFNAPDHIATLPALFAMRLGLSATPYDQFSEHFLDEYFDGIVYEFPLSRAIMEKVLTPYRHHVITAYLSDQEQEAYEEITRKLAKIVGVDEILTRAALARAQPLLLARARIVGACSDKLSTLEILLNQIGRQKYCLFYCGDGSTEESGDVIRQVESVSMLLHKLGWNSSRITAEERLSVRESLLAKLQDGSLDGVVSIRVLDEGIDIPVCRTAFILASQSSERQGIQRRGRILRRAEGKELADLYDFVVIGGAAKSKSMSRLARKELRRSAQFAADAINKDESLEGIEGIAKSIGVSMGGDDGKGPY